MWWSKVLKRWRALQICRQRVNSASWWANDHKPSFPLILLQFKSCLFIYLFCSQYIVFALLIQWRDWHLQENLVTVTSWSWGRWFICYFVLFLCFSRVCSTSGWSLTSPFCQSPGNTVFWLETFDYGLAHRFCTFASVIIKPFYPKPPSPHFGVLIPTLLSDICVDPPPPSGFLSWAALSCWCQSGSPNHQCRFFTRCSFHVCLFRLFVESNKVYI